MKVAIFTFHRAINYGAVLQAYALKIKIDELGCQVNIVDYLNMEIENSYQLMTWKFWKLKSFMGHLLKIFYSKAKKEKFIAFRQKHLSMTFPIINRKELEKLNEEYNCFITGSDQVWNYKLTGFDKTYFLDFVRDDRIKNSYAASFGLSRIPAKQQLKYRELLTNFNIITIRERQGANIVEELCDKKPAVVLDPTLLLDKNDWAKIEKKPTGGKYILLYLLAESKNINRLAENMSQKTGYKVINISSCLRKRVKAEYIRTAGPEEFIGLFMNAEYVFTNSFHGIVFSINFNKKFFTELLDGTMSSVNSRLENVLDVFCLRDRQIINGKNPKLYDEIDYGRVNQILDRERKKSMGYLSEIVSGYHE